jgi:hypothetical protein
MLFYILDPRKFKLLVLDAICISCICRLKIYYSVPIYIYLRKVWLSLFHPISCNHVDLSVACFFSPYYSARFFIRASRAWAMRSLRKGINVVQTFESSKLFHTWLQKEIKDPDHFVTIFYLQDGINVIFNCLFLIILRISSFVLICFMTWAV